MTGGVGVYLAATQAQETELGGGGGTGPQAERQLQVVGGANIHSTVVQL